MSANNKKKKTVFTVIFIIGIIILIIGIVMLIYPYIKPEESYEQPTTEATEPNQTTEPELKDNPIDFQAIIDKHNNTDIYAWLYVPETKINYPVLQSADREDEFYLHHDLDKNYLYSGSLFTEKMNSKDFTDSVTVIYGHNYHTGIMFRSLHNYEDEDFFKKNQYFYIYTPGHILTYHIFSAFDYDDRHIMNTFDFSDKEVLQEFIDNAFDPRSRLCNVNKDITVTTDDSIVVLSTCIDGYKNRRYLVMGVLENDELTK